MSEPVDVVREALVKGLGFNLMKNDARVALAAIASLLKELSELREENRRLADRVMELTELLNERAEKHKLRYQRIESAAQDVAGWGQDGMGHGTTLDALVDKLRAALTKPVPTEEP